MGREGRWSSQAQDPQGKALLPIDNPSGNKPDSLHPTAIAEPPAATPYLAMSFRLSTVMPWLDRTEDASSWASVRTTSP